MVLDLDALWLVVLIFMSLGVMAGTTCAVMYRLACSFFARPSMLAKLFAVVYPAAVMFSFAVLLMAFFSPDSRHFNVSLVVFLVFAAYFAHFALNAHRGGFILNKMLGD